MGGPGISPIAQTAPSGPRVAETIFDPKEPTSVNTSRSGRATATAVGVGPVRGGNGITHGASAKGVVDVAGLGVDVTGVAVGEAWDADGVAFTSLGGRPGCFLQPAASVHVQVSSLVSCDPEFDCHMSLNATSS